MDNIGANVRSSWDNVKALFQSKEGKWIIGLIVVIVLAVIYFFKIPIWKAKYRRRFRRTRVRYRTRFVRARRRRRRY